MSARAHGGQVGTPVVSNLIWGVFWMTFMIGGASMVLLFSAEMKAQWVMRPVAGRSEQERAEPEADLVSRPLDKGLLQETAGKERNGLARQPPATQESESPGLVFPSRPMAGSPPMQEPSEENRPGRPEASIVNRPLNQSTPQQAVHTNGHSLQQPGKEPRPEKRPQDLGPPSMPWRDLPSGRSLGLVPFMPAREAVPDPPYVWTEKEMWKAEGPRFNRSNIIWIHLHNFGGSTVCGLAQRNYERVGRENCNYPGDSVVGLGKGRPYAHLARCVERAGHQQVTLSMIERGLEEGDLGCTKVLTGISLREPISGVRSTTVFHHFEPLVEEILQHIAEKKPMRNVGQHNGIPGNHSYQFFDNFVVRTLSGQYWAPPGGLTRKHLEAAKEVLKRIDVIMILEEFGKHVPQLTRHFKWSLGSGIGAANAHPGIKKKEAISDASMQLFKKLSSLDYELYEFGQELAAERTRLAKEPR